MTKGSNRLSVLDFIIAVLSKHEKELDKSLVKLEHMTKKLERNDLVSTSDAVSPPHLKTSSERKVRRRTKSKTASL